MTCEELLAINPQLGDLVRIQTKKYDTTTPGGFYTQAEVIVGMVTDTVTYVMRPEILAGISLFSTEGRERYAFAGGIVDYSVILKYNDAL